MIDNSGIANALLATLGSSTEHRAATNCNSCRVELNAFVNQVQAQSDKHLTADAANALINDAESLLASCWVIIAGSSADGFALVSMTMRLDDSSATRAP